MRAGTAAHRGRRLPIADFADGALDAPSHAHAAVEDGEHAARARRVVANLYVERGPQSPLQWT